MTDARNAWMRPSGGALVGDGPVVRRVGRDDAGHVHHVLTGQVCFTHFLQTARQERESVCVCVCGGGGIVCVCVWGGG